MRNSIDIVDLLKDLGVLNIITPVEGRQNITQAARERLIDDATHREQYQD